MPEPNPSVESLLRSRRRWMVAAVASWAALTLVTLTLLAFCWQLHAEAQRQRAAAEATRREVELSLERTQQLLYAQRIHLAQKELEQANAEKAPRK